MDSVAHVPSLNEATASLEQTFRECPGEGEAAAAAVADMRLVEAILIRRRVGVFPVRRKRHLALFLGALGIGLAVGLFPSSRGVVVHPRPGRTVAAHHCRRPDWCAERAERL